MVSSVAVATDLPELPADIASRSEMEAWWKAARQVIARLIAANAAAASATSDAGADSVATPQSVSWSSVTDKPATYPPASHAHSDYAPPAGKAFAIGVRASEPLTAGDADSITRLAAISFLKQDARTFLAGPILADPDDPTFRPIQKTDLPDLSATYQPRSEGLDSLSVATQTTFGLSLLGLAAAANLRASAGLASTDAAEFLSLKTGAPTGSTAQAVKIGDVTADAVTPTFTHSLRIEHNGALYDVMLRAVV